jgi:hypothetical protein
MILQRLARALTVRNAYRTVVSLIGLPLVIFLWRPETILLFNTLDHPWSRRAMGCQSYDFLCLSGHGWVFGWWHVASLSFIGFVVALSFYKAAIGWIESERSGSLPPVTPLPPEPPRFPEYVLRDHSRTGRDADTC